MTTSPGTQVRPLAETAEHKGRLLPPARYRHPGDVIRLITAGLVLAGALAVTVTTHATYAGASAAAVAAFTPPALAGRVLAGLVQAVLVTAAAAAVAVTLRYRRFRLLAGLAGAAVLAGAVVTGIIHLAGGQRPRDLAAGAGQWPWLTGGSLAGPALLAAAVAVTVAAAPWLSRPWRRAAWVTLWLAAVVRLITGTAAPMEVVMAFAAGVTAGAGVLVLFGVPDRRLGPAGDRGGAGLGGPAGDQRRAGRGRGEGLAAVRRGRRGREAVVHQGPRLGSAGRRPALPRLPVHPAARGRRHPARRLAHPGRRASGARRRHGGAGRGGGARHPAR